MLKTLDKMLNGEIDPASKDVNMSHKLPLTPNDGPLHALLSSWDDVKGDVAAILSTADKKVVKDIWARFLIREKGRECKICGKVIRNKMKLMRKHFLDVHWPMEEKEKGKDKGEGRVDSMEVGGDEVSGDGDEDAMEIE